MVKEYRIYLDITLWRWHFCHKNMSREEMLSAKKTPAKNRGTAEHLRGSPATWHGSVFCVKHFLFGCVFHTLLQHDNPNLLVLPLLTTTIKFMCNSNVCYKTCTNKKRRKFQIYFFRLKTIAAVSFHINPRIAIKYERALLTTWKKKNYYIAKFIWKNKNQKV